MTRSPTASDCHHFLPPRTLTPMTTCFLHCSIIVVSLALATDVAAEPFYPHHPISLSFAGPQVSENDGVNPFTDYRLLVTFRHGSESVVVRGFYAADGNAAHSQETQGNVWQVRFAPPEPGVWSWSADLRRGSHIAIETDPHSGAPIPLANPEGKFTVSPQKHQPHR